jgi:hypothetical protein
MINHHILRAMARERSNALLAEAAATRRSSRHGLRRRRAGVSVARRSPTQSPTRPVRGVSR